MGHNLVLEHSHLIPIIGYQELELTELTDRVHHLLIVT